MPSNTPLQIGNQSFTQRLLLGTAQYPSLTIMEDAVRASEAEIITVSVRRQTAATDGNAHTTNPFWQHIKALKRQLLPNTAGCYSAQEALHIAHIARELFDTTWVKLEVIGDRYTLQPHPSELLKATETLIQDGFTVLPYCTDDLVLCQELVSLGCTVLMPWAAPIGSGQGLLNPFALRTLRARFPDITLIVDAGIGAPSHAVQAMELGFDAVLLNSAVSLSQDPVAMATAFKKAVQAGGLAHQAGIIPKRNMAVPSTPATDRPFWHHTAPSPSSRGLTAGPRKQKT